jgi:HJR/Mrr/RecB family endonuclease
MEELVGAILKAEWGPCEVMHCGGPLDQGIDLIAVRGEEDFAIQVKRRAKPEAVERVRAVREFLGACLLQGMQRLVFVSTADHFSGGRYGASETAQSSVEKGLVKSFQLIDRNRLFDMFELRRQRENEVWRRHIDSRFL